MRVPVRAGSRTVAFPAPAPTPTGLIRAQFDAARNHRRLRTWNPTSAEINTIMAYDGAQLLRRSRDLCRNNGYVSNAREVYATALVGTGIKMSWLFDDLALKAELQDLWLSWTWEADADGLCDWEGLQALAARELFEAGELFVRLRARFPQDPMAVPFQLQLMPAEMLDYGFNGVNGTNVIVQGVEFDVLDRRVAYWFWRRHPGDAVTPLTSDPQTQFGRVRIPADQVLHVFRPEYIGQVRGIPRTRTAMILAKMLDDYNDAELDRKRTAALFCGFVTENASGDEVLPTVPGPGGPLAGLAADDDGTPLAPLEPATFQKLRPGEGVEFATPADVGGNYDVFQYRVLCAMAVAMGVPYAALTGDLKGATYSSDRSGMVRFRQRTEQEQHSVAVFQLCRPVFAEWQRLAYLGGRIDLPQYDLTPGLYQRTKWITPAWPWVDPESDRKGVLLDLQMGLISRDDAIEAQGEDPDDVDRRIAAARDRAKNNYGLSFPIIEGVAQAAGQAAAQSGNQSGDQADKRADKPASPAQGEGQPA